MGKRKKIYRKGECRMKRILLEVDDKLHRDFKSKCYSNYSTMKDVIVDFIKEYIKNNKEV